jgi:hypothetical protein
VAEAPKALALDWQTVLMQSVRKLRTSAGAERHAQSSVTSSQPEGSASPMGIRQLKMQDGADSTAGRAVMVYSGEVDVDSAALADVDMDVSLIEPDMSVELELEVVATARAAKLRRLWSFMMKVAVTLENSIDKDVYEA